ncbi:heterokaryon incompatibility protein-domain-containing protein [Xylaria arbuscula]|nr:heterokaryon incompatibility protein-domain-containing protein [Xylaria arbuscula]
MHQYILALVALLLSLLVGLGSWLAWAARRRASPVSPAVDEERQPLLRPSLPDPKSSGASTSSVLTQDLNYEELEIRLLLLHAGSGNDKLECDLQIESLRPDMRAPAYEALSYVWAEIPGERSVYVDGFQFSVTENLAQALEHLRHPDRNRLLWVDAICINQHRDIERGHQVRLMGTVYSRAAQVLIWLGPESHDSAQAFRDLEQLSQNKHFRELDFYGKLTEDGQWVPAPVESVFPIENLLKRSYWSRIWVVQEIVRANHATVFCGKSSIAWDTCIQVRDNWPKHSRSCCNTECSLMDSRVRRSLNWLNSSWRRYRSVDGDLLSRLSLARGLQASDHRDKIFGVLGLVDDQSYSLDPDYASNFQTVYREWTYHIIECTGQLDVFLYTDYNLRHDVVPTWVPDWTKYNDSVRFQTERLEHHRHISRSFSAAGSTDLNATFVRYGDRLRLAGFHLDTVKEVGDALVYDRQARLTDDENQVGAIKAWNSVLKSWSRVAERASSAKTSYPSGEKYSDAYWKTLISDHITEVGSYLGDRASADDEKRYSNWVDWFEELVAKPDAAKTAFYKDTLALDRDLDRFDWTIMNMNYNRRLFSTSDGRIGMGPAEVKPGDQVTLLRAGRTPFILRQGEKVSSQGNVHQVIGYAYVHGVMDGEAAPLAQQWKDCWLA